MKPTPATIHAANLGALIGLAFLAAVSKRIGGTVEVASRTRCGDWPLIPSKDIR